MRTVPAITLAAASLLVAVPAWADGSTASSSTASGSSALALAALVSQQSPTLSLVEKRVLASFFAGNAKTPYAPGKTITVSAAKIVCKAGDVDITLHQCDLTFGAKTVTLTGEKAHELYATIAEVGVPSDGAAGTIYEALSQLSCTIDPAQIRAEGGGGATCNFTPGAS
jgi:hypothetical protein